MKYYKEENAIKIFGLEDFCISDILLCGQVFRFFEKDGSWHVFSKDKRCVVTEHRAEDYAEILTDDVDYFENYFDLSTDYGKIKSALKEYNIPFLSKAIDTYSGIRILNQDIFETFFSFIISQNNNISRIQKIIDSLCTSFGKNMGDYYAFPEFEVMRNLTQEDFDSTKMGYRSSYFVKSLQAMEKDTLESLKSLPYDLLKKKLLSFTGVGNKVADCILLFAYHSNESFPCDVWIEKMYNEHFGKENDRNKISENLVKIFKNLSGYAQQYLFYYIRTA